eukprot:CAMPEP_0195582086 /NCGR_PEP_ID=MMETSP0814-20130614/21521_1 /TAXON_ID=97485 /ORGANISM="Prymnesium parvum, Strain Texoma1" /LENGTH=75 /DNA_ID=CAMNT_0040719599 /DNA_START=112 /DNA_END=336 /DNA_ORIENTATION=+
MRSSALSKETARGAGDTGVAASTTGGADDPSDFESAVNPPELRLSTMADGASFSFRLTLLDDIFGDFDDSPNLAS